MALFGSVALGGMALAAMAVIALSGCSITFPGDAESRTETHVVDDAVFDQLLVMTDTGWIEVVAADVTEIEVTARITESRDGDGSSPVAIDGDMLEVTCWR